MKRLSSVVFVVGVAVNAAFGAVITVPDVGKFPNGEASIADPLLWGGGTLTTNNAVYYYVGDTFRFFLDGSDVTLTNYVESASANFMDRSWVAPYTPQVLTTDILNGGHYKINNAYITCGLEGTHHTLKARSGGVLESTGISAGSTTQKSSVSFEITDGGYLVTTNGRPQCFSKVDGKYRFLIDNATWKTAGWWLGNDGMQAYNEIVFAATNAVIESHGALNPVFNDDSDFIFGPGTVFKSQSTVIIDSGAHVTFDDATSPRTTDFPNGVWQLGYRTSTRENVLLAKGESRLYPIGFQVGGSASQTGRVVVADNALVEMTLPTFSYDNERFGVSGAGFLEIRDNGTFRAADDCYAAMPLQFGVNAGSYGQLDIYGGLLEYYCYGTRIGGLGTGVYNVYGGETRHNWINMNSESGGTGTATFRQTGGVVKVRNQNGTINAENGRVNVAMQARAGTMYLEGGVLECGYVMASNPDCATVVADGGTIRRVGTYSGTIADKSLIRDIGSFTVGAKGLTIDIQGSDDVAVKQAMASVAGQAGVLRKVGAGTLTLTEKKYDLAQLVVAQGTLAIGANATLGADTSVTVTNGTTFSLVGVATSVTVKDLVVTNGVLKIDPNDKIVVTGRTAFNRLRVAFSTLPTVDQAADFLVCAGELDADTLQALRRAIFTNVLENGTHGVLTVSYDSGTGKTTVKVAVKTNVPIADETAWRGSGAWETDANWSAGVPTATKAAVFDKDSTSTDVSVGAGAAAGALRLSGRDFTLTGASALTMPSEEGSLEIKVDSGAQTVDVPLKQDALMALSVASGAVVTLSQTIDGAGFLKTGRGKASLSGDNSFYGAVTANGGITSVDSPEALGTVGDDRDNLVYLADGTLEIAGDGDEELTFAHDLRVKTSATTKPTVVKSERDAVFAKGLGIDQGCFVKRGAGRLTIPVRDGDSLTMSSDGNSGSSEHYDYPEDGTPPANLYVGVTVVEGELLLKPAVPETHPSVALKNTLYCGVKTTVKKGVNPTLALEDVSVDASGKSWTIARGCNDVYTEAMEPKLRMVNAELTLYSLIVGTWAYNNASRPWLVFTNATVTTTSSIQPTTSNGANAPVQFFGKDTDFFAAGGFTFGGGINLDVDGCRMVGANGVPTTFRCGSYAGNCTLNFRNGTEVGLGVLDFDEYGVNAGSQYRFANFTFDDSTWNVGANDITIDATTAYPGRLHFYSQGETGLTVRVSSGHTLNFADEPLAGAGGLVVTGGGTVAFGNGKLQATGTLVAADGTLDLTNAGTIEGAVIGAGAGVIKGGTFHNATLVLEPFHSSTFQPFNFADCAFTGTTRVTIGGEPAKAADVTVANYTGTLTGVGTFRLKGWKGYGGVFTAKDGQITADIDRRGLMLIVR